MTNIIKTTINNIESFSELLGKLTGILMVIMVLAMTTVVVLRYVFDIGLIALQETVLYLHAAAFLLGCGYTLKRDEHVRVDVFNRRFSTRGKAWVELFGHLFLALPVVGFIFFISLDYVTDAWFLKESSPEPGGLPFVYLQKSFILLFSLTLALQVIAMAAKSVCQLCCAGKQGEVA